MRWYPHVLYVPVQNVLVPPCPILLTNIPLSVEFTWRTSWVMTQADCELIGWASSDSDTLFADEEEQHTCCHYWVAPFATTMANGICCRTVPPSWMRIAFPHHWPVEGGSKPGWAWGWRRFERCDVLLTSEATLWTISSSWCLVMADSVVLSPASKSRALEITCIGRKWVLTSFLAKWRRCETF